MVQCPSIARAEAVATAIPTFFDSDMDRQKVPFIHLPFKPQKPF
jgi:hypothetical protein